MPDHLFAAGDLVQLDTEYRAGNASLFRITDITGGQATLTQLSPDSSGTVGVDTSVDIEDPDMVPAYPEVLAQYPQHTEGL